MSEAGDNTPRNIAIKLKERKTTPASLLKTNTSQAAAGLAIKPLKSSVNKPTKVKSSKKK